jgi:hypothetical protein
LIASHSENENEVIPEGTVVEIASPDGSVREDVAWEGVNIRLTWDGAGAWVAVKGAVESPFEWNWDPKTIDAPQDGQALKAAADRAAAEKAAADRLAAERAAADHAAAERVAAENAAEDWIAAEMAATDKAAAEKTAAEKLVALDPNKQRLKKTLVACAFALAIAGAGAYLLNRPSDVEAIAFGNARVCAAGKTCGMASCTAAYHRDFPNGRHIEEISRIDRESGGVCSPGPDVALYNSGLACANDSETNRRPCDVDSCFTDLRTRFPNTTLLAVEQERLRRNADACNAAELSAYNGGAACATSTPCNTACFNDYRTRYPNGQYRSRMNAAIVQAQNACRALTQPPQPCAPPTSASTPTAASRREANPAASAA